MKTRSGFVILFHLFLFLRESQQLPPGHPLRATVDKANESGPFIGVVMAWQAEADTIQSSSDFVPNSDFPPLDLHGHLFHIGSIRDVNVIFVMSGQRRLNAGVTIQTLLDNFNIWGIVHYGTAGSANDSMSFGDVSVLKSAAFTGSWEWTKYQSEKSKWPQIAFGAYNYPKKGENFLSRVEFKPEEFFSVGNSMQQVFWQEVDKTWFQVAEQLKNLELERCVNETYCLPETPKLVYGLRGATADIFVNNAAYRQFLFEKFHVSTVDEESSAIIMVAKSSKIPVIVFRGVSDLAGGEVGRASTNLSSLASANALNAAVEFIELIGKKEKLMMSAPSLK